MVEHPEFARVVWDLPAAKKGKVTVGQGRGGPFEIAYEVHGRGPTHMVVGDASEDVDAALTNQWIMGLGSLMRSWQRQTKDFAHDRASEFTSLIFDNKGETASTRGRRRSTDASTGMGYADTPRMRYTTSDMAKDTVELLDQLEWTGKRELHVVGISMGGMIAQELVQRPQSWRRRTSHRRRPS